MGATSAYPNPSKPTVSCAKDMCISQKHRAGFSKSLLIGNISCGKSFLNSSDFFCGENFFRKNFNKDFQKHPVASESSRLSRYGSDGAEKNLTSSVLTLYNID